MIEETLPNETRRLLFLVAAWMANVDGEEHGAEVEALCELRRALHLEPPAARELLQMARSQRNSLVPAIDAPVAAPRLVKH